MTIATTTTLILLLHSCNAHNTTENSINVKQLSYLVKASSMQTIRMTTGKLVF